MLGVGNKYNFTKKGVFSYVTNIKDIIDINFMLKFNPLYIHIYINIVNLYKFIKFLLLAL